MAFNVNDFRASLIFDGARASLFEVVMILPPIAGIGAILDTEIRFKARATSLPGDNISSISVPYFGREIKVAGTRTFPDWSVTVINDEDFRIRNNLERWMSNINSHVNNRRSAEAASANGYQTDAWVYQYGKTGGLMGTGTPTGEAVPIKSYKFVNMFPIDVSPIDLDWGSGDEIENFTVTFAYQWWESLFPVATTDTTSGIVG